MTRDQKIWMTLAIIVGWGGLMLKYDLDFRRMDEKFQHDTEQRHADRERFHAKMLDFQRRLGCQGDVDVFGMCTDPPCIDSDAAGDTDPRYVRGRVTFYERISLFPHQTVEDTCAGPEDLSEGACKGEPDGGAPSAELVTIHCEKGCRDGACIR